ncbi:TonB family protein [Pseudodesulfovibrio sp.]|uniref:TonB family protein n=1 Tax=Pseudodesulfovibrio sp. TaxID=2035812 RepID=UPI00260B46D3|nr:TonB family protein [Pseudodesulfovibrio sp.]MDD3312171.1 TonB family protein [Pseudodesulfovibrio sp.]
MNSRQTIWACLAISLCLHWFLLQPKWGGAPTPPGESIVIPVNFDISAAAAGGTGLALEQGAVPDEEKTEHEDVIRRLRRQALKKYLAQVHSAVEQRRLPPGADAADLIGNVRYRFRIRADDTFEGIVMQQSSGDARLDAAARRAIEAASGTVKRPDILKGRSWTITMTVKYQYRL